jgi:predicted nucleic acid-binding protein
MLVADASAVVALLLARPQAVLIAAHIVDHGYPLHAPHVIDLEVLNALRRIVRTGEASPARADEVVDDLLDLDVERHSHHALVRRGWELRDNFTAYDAAYLALAEDLTAGGATLLTTDARFARAARTHSNIEVVLAE